MPALLRVMRFIDDPGFYLLYLAEDGSEITDTLHDTTDAAMEQARWEFGIEKDEWVITESVD